MANTNNHYSSERNVQIIISLLKAHNVSIVVASPGTTNMCFVGSIQNDPYFKVYSSVDERSAAYMACGLAEQTGEPVVLSCTGATASRNYYPGLTEAFYKKLPIIAITSHQGTYKIGHLKDQNIDRRQLPLDLVRISVEAVVVKDKVDEHFCEIEVNKAILETRRHGGGPVHINLFTTYSQDFSVKQLPRVQVIRRYMDYDEHPSLPNGRIAIFCGSHTLFTEKQTKAIDKFCANHNAVVFCDHSSGYYGKYRVQFALALTQFYADTLLRRLRLLIHIGEVSGDTTTGGFIPNEVWRVSPDGEIRDLWGKLTSVFEMDEISFFNKYTHQNIVNDSYLKECLSFASKLNSQIEEVPFSNIWVAQNLSNDLPKESRIYLGILNSLRAWNYFETDKSISGSSNVGGFGIDGGLSTMIGSSLVSPTTIHYCFIGDLAFFYDVNIMTNAHIGPNVRILLLNNGRGVEMRNSHSPASVMGESGDLFFAAAGHFGNQSKKLVKDLAEERGFEYMAAKTKEEFKHLRSWFLSTELTDRPLLLEVFVDYKNEDIAYKTMAQLAQNRKNKLYYKAKDAIRKILSPRGVEFVKKNVLGGVKSDILKNIIEIKSPTEFNAIIIDFNTTVKMAA